MPQPALKKFCAFCGNPIELYAKFCSDCGVSLKSNIEVTKTPIQESSELEELELIKKSRKKSKDADYRVIGSKNATNYNDLDTSYKIQKEDQFLRWETEYKKGFAKPLILLMLEEQDDYAYALTKRISVITRGHINIATSNIYPIIKNLRNSYFL